MYVHVHVPRVKLIIIEERVSNSIYHCTNTLGKVMCQAHEHYDANYVTILPVAGTPPPP